MELLLLRQNSVAKLSLSDIGTTVAEATMYCLFLETWVDIELSLGLTET